MNPSFRNNLTAWFNASARELPWRSRPTPYRVWISEIMLQQTRVETVREYFNRFIKRFPNIRRLAAADLDDVLATWAGLGYYRRARMLHRAARHVVAKHNGRFPSRRDDILALPGVGRYTAGAILSIAFNRPEPIVDGNIQRVFARLARINGNVKSREGRNAIWARSTEHVRDGAADGHSPSVLNQALMELGALVCRPKSPGCAACPVQFHCGAFRHGEVERYPVLPARKQTRRRTYLFVALRDARGRILLVRRDHGDAASLLPDGMWELPHIEWTGKRPPLAALRESLDLDFRTTGRRLTRSHAIMDFRLTLAVQAATTAQAVRNTSKRRWFTPEEAAGAGTSSATRKLIDALR